ncbi:hypothetical protein, partial [Acidisphaera rubrifaciens]|uniref:hypothetical protein n=1 Tax=Acidisphaera rubrifaciens TaxID=50715 RepID=UPI00066202F2
LDGGRTGGRGRLWPVLRLLLAGCAVAAVLSKPRLPDWAANHPWIADSAALQAAVGEADRALAAIGLPGPFDWLRTRTRALQALRFNHDQDDQQ